MLLRMMTHRPLVLVDEESSQACSRCASCRLGPPAAARAPGGDGGVGAARGGDRPGLAPAGARGAAGVRARAARGAGSLVQRTAARAAGHGCH